jgi:hypothetical protein
LGPAFAGPGTFILLLLVKHKHVQLWFFSGPDDRAADSHNLADYKIHKHTIYEAQAPRLQHLISRMLLRRELSFSEGNTLNTDHVHGSAVVDRFILQFESQSGKEAEALATVQRYSLLKGSPLYELDRKLCSLQRENAKA